MFAVERTPGIKLLRGPTRCPACKAKKHRDGHYEWRAANPEQWKLIQDRANAKRLADPEHRRRKRADAIQRTYGLAPDELQGLMDAQGGKCAICGYVPPPRDESVPLPRGRASTGLHVDHCHTNGHVRGLLCGSCNTGLGLFRDNPAVLAAAIEYLKRE